MQTIDDDDNLLRGIADRPNMWRRDPDGAVRPTSAAFKPSQADQGVSVDVQRLLPDPARPESAIRKRGHGLVSLVAADVRALDGLDVIHAPLDDNFAHANIVGFEHLSKARAKRHRTTIARASAWIRRPAGAPL